MLYKSFIFLSTLLITSFLITPVEAHVLKTDGTVGAVMHVSPEDDPIANSPTDFFFEFKDRENNFQPELCNCTVKVLQNDNILHEQDLFSENAEPSLSNASFRYTFPARNVYQIQISGKPLEENAFSPFILTYDLRVARDAIQTEKADNSTFIVYVVLGLITILFICLIIMKRYKRGGEKHK